MTAQSGLTQCEYEDWQAADAELNAVYGEALAKAGAAGPGSEQRPGGIVCVPLSELASPSATRSAGSRRRSSAAGRRSR